MRYRRRLIKPATHGILLVRVGDFARCYPVLNDGYQYIALEDFNKRLNYERFREVYKRAFVEGEIYFTGSVYAYKSGSTFYAFDERPQQVETSDYRIVGFGNGIFNSLRASVSDATFDAVPSLSIDVFLREVERLRKNRLGDVSGYAAAIKVEDVLGDGGLVNGA